MNPKNWGTGITRKDKKRTKLPFHIFYGGAKRKHGGTGKIALCKMGSVYSIGPHIIGLSSF